MTLSSECRTVQNPLIRYATEAGWTYLPPDDAIRLRHGETRPIFWCTFIEKAQALNPGVVDHLKAEELARQLIRVPPTKGNAKSHLPD